MRVYEHMESSESMDRLEVPGILRNLITSGWEAATQESKA